jgi:hypothetical protein
MKILKFLTWGRNSLERYFPILEDLRKTKQQFADFSLFGASFGGHGSIEDKDLFGAYFGGHESIEDRDLFEPKQWWDIHDQHTPELKSIALKVLGQPLSFACERNCSTYGFIHRLRRDKLTPTHAEDLVFIHSNLRMLSRRTEDYLKGPS